MSHLITTEAIKSHITVQRRLIKELQRLPPTADHPTHNGAVSGCQLLQSMQHLMCQDCNAGSRVALFLRVLQF